MRKKNDEHSADGKVFYQHLMKSFSCVIKSELSVKRNHINKKKIVFKCCVNGNENAIFVQQKLFVVYL